jgi:predicted nucleic acid-binding protein
MQHKRLVIDANILIRAVLGSRVRGLIEHYCNSVAFYADDVLIEVETEAKARIASRDVNDWPTVAAALLLDCPIWMEDKDFLGAGVATWTTATVEIYLADS